jgi:hypothetical protein
MPFNRSFVCTYVRPGLECNYGESIVLGVCFWVAALVSFGLLIHSLRKSKGKIPCDQTAFFWIFLTIWQTYQGIVSIFAFSWDIRSFKLWYQALNHILMFIPMCLVILILFDLLFNYRNPGNNAIVFFRSLFVIFLVTFVLLGITLGLVDLDSESDLEASLTLWCACTDLLLAVFFALPARSLLEAVTYPMVQPEDVCCVNFCKVGIFLYVLLFGGRMLWNGTHYFGVNTLQDWINGQQNDDNTPNGAARSVNFAFNLLFNFVASVLGMISVFLFKKHDQLFNENPYYTRQSD